MSNKAFGILAAAVAGAVAGVVAGILIAPRSGVETREKMAQAAGQSWDEIVDGFEVNAEAAGEQAQEAAQAAQEKTDELREKVAAARARMNQVRADIAKTAERVAGQPAEQDADPAQAVEPSQAE